MAQVVGRSRRRLGGETLRLLTTFGALVLAVLVVFLALAIRSRVGTGAVISGLLVFGVLLVPGKLLLDRLLLGVGGTRRAEDSAVLARLLESLPEGWYVAPGLLVAGTVVEFLVAGPGGLYAVEVYRGLARDTGTGFHDRVAIDLAARASELELGLARMTGTTGIFLVQPVFCAVEAEGVRLGDLVVHPEAVDLREFRGVLIATPDNLGALLRAGGPRHGVRTRSLDSGVSARLMRLLSDEQRTQQTSA